MAHNPVTFPEVSSKGSIIDTGKEAFIAVSAEYTESSPLVRNLDVERRNCIFADEKNVPRAEITVFKVYSQVSLDNILKGLQKNIKDFSIRRKTVYWNVEQKYF